MADQKVPTNTTTKKVAPNQRKLAPDHPQRVSTPVPLRTKTAVDLEGVPHQIPSDQLHQIEHLCETEESVSTSQAVSVFFYFFKTQVLV